MSLEIELKVRVDDHDVVRRRLVALGAEPLGAVLEFNRLFDTRDGALARGGVGLRVRTHLPQPADQAVTPVGASFPPASASGTAKVTVKGPQRPGPFKVRPEEEFDVADGDAVARAFALLGYETTIAFEKRRESWRLGDCRIELDALPLLGLFVEVEGPSEQAVSEVRRRLGLDAHPHVQASYVSLLDEACRDRGLDPHVFFQPSASSSHAED
ncbi:MAG: hypothetical protein BroJett003_05260 [Planctomycetota bacterium]|nr:MAG: hypothetical protein BroJett003_05260 [Planctomycetota bacterium]